MSQPTSVPQTRVLSARRQDAAATLRRRGASALETVMLLAAVGIPLMVLVFVGIRMLAAHYSMVSTLNALPIP